tara:strand:+ start:435 stop:623 length:189 start_codon:yes stop_codon:yes gene_type:complete
MLLVNACRGLHIVLAGVLAAALSVSGWDLLQSNLLLLTVEQVSCPLAFLEFTHWPEQLKPTC